MKLIIIALSLLAVFGCTKENSMAIDKKNPADAGKGLRLMVLTTPASRFGYTADKDYPRVFGVLTDWNLGDQTASILATRAGTASLYTTSTFGILGGEGHESARQAAQGCVKIAEDYFDRSSPVSEFPYPPQGKVHFYLLTYDGVRLCVGDESGINSGSDITRPLFAEAQKVLTALREISETK